MIIIFYNIFRINKKSIENYQKIIRSLKEDENRCLSCDANRRSISEYEKTVTDLNNQIEILKDIVDQREKEIFEMKILNQNYLSIKEHKIELLEKENLKYRDQIQVLESAVKEYLIIIEQHQYIPTTPTNDAIENQGIHNHDNLIDRENHINSTPMFITNNLFTTDKLIVVTVISFNYYPTLRASQSTLPSPIKRDSDKEIQEMNKVIIQMLTNNKYK